MKTRTRRRSHSDRVQEICHRLLSRGEIVTLEAVATLAGLKPKYAREVLRGLMRKDLILASEVEIPEPPDRGIPSTPEGMDLIELRKAEMRILVERDPRRYRGAVAWTVPMARGNASRGLNGQAGGGRRAVE